MHTFEFVRERLVQAGAAGASPADLFKALRESEVKRRGGTYSSFFRYFHMLFKLGWVVRTNNTAPAYQRGVEETGVLSDKRFYRISQKGKKAPPDDWGHPQSTLYPAYAEKGRSGKWYTPSWRGPGRPRKERRRRKGVVITGVPLKPEVEMQIVDLTSEVEKAFAKFEKYKVPNVKGVEKELDRLDVLGIDTTDVREKFEEYTSVSSEDYDTADEYREAKDDAWSEFLSAVDEIDATAVETTVTKKPITVVKPTPEPEEPILKAPRAKRKPRVVTGEPVVAPTPGRRIRLSPAQLFLRRLVALAPRAEALREDPAGLPSFQDDIDEIYSELEEAREKASDADREALQALWDRLDRVGDGLWEMRAGLRDKNKVTYIRGWEKVRTCCRE